MTAQLLGSHPTALATSSINKRAVRGLLAVGAAAALMATVAVPASAAPGDTSADTTQANVEVTTAIALTALTTAFTITGAPLATVAEVGAVTMNVDTNNLAGYAVTVQAAAATLVAVTPPANADTIPIAALSVRETGTTPYTPLSSTAPVTVHSQATRSALGGDPISNDYSVDIPFVNEDTYTVTLNYIATTL